MRLTRRRRTVHEVGRFSEPFPPHGALAAKGAENLLGRPRLDPLVVLAREAVQNSWDARLGDASPLSFTIAMHHLTERHRSTARDEVFRDPPKAAHRLREVLQRNDLLALSLTDRGASGLAGPIRADRPPRRGEPSNFVDLLFNIGQPVERDFGGGTYGFGRTISYVVSEARAIVVYSRTREGRRREARFIAAAFTDHYTEHGRRYTGRHWWGDVSADTIEPVVGDAADALAASLGLPTFAPDETGTTICVLAPDLRGRTPLQACRFMANALTWNFWPKMTPERGTKPAMTFAVELDGEPVPVPSPAELPPIGALARCLQRVRAAHLAPGPQAAGAAGAARSSPDELLEPVILPKTGETIGWLALARVPIHARPFVDEGDDEDAELGPSAPFPAPAHHVALLREPELLVEYLSTTELPAGSSEYVGVFKPRRELDRAFAKAEPPTHDGWNPNLVPETKLRRFVNVALRSIREQAAEFAGQHAEPTDAGVAQVADALDSLFHGSAPTAPAPIVTMHDVRLMVDGQALVNDVEFSVEHAPGSTGSIIEASAHVATHDGWTLERDASRSPLPPPEVEVIGFSCGTDRTVDGARLVIRKGEPERWTVRVRSGPDHALGLDLAPSAIREPAS